MENSTSSHVKFTPIPIFSSNYVWVIEYIATQEAYIVDPGSAPEVEEYLVKNQLKLVGILVTHSHNDHIGGINELKSKHSVPVYGPDCPSIPQVDNTVFEGDDITLWPADDKPAITATVHHYPGHLPEHLGYLVNTFDGWLSLFCGDTLFSSGCGKMFSGPAEVFKRSLDRIASLAKNTRIYCAHEYTQANLAFAKHVEPNNPHLAEKSEAVASLLSIMGCSLPSTIESELLTNPFLRTNQKELLGRIEELTGQQPKSEEEAFALLRKLKDSF